MLKQAAYIAIPLFLTIGLIRKYLDYVWGHCRSTHSLRGKTFLITGANSGIGFETAKALAQRHARVILACRNPEKAKKAISDIRSSCKKCGELIFMQVDLSSLESVKQFVSVVQTGFDKIDVLINNAGVYYPLSMHETTKDGYEAHFGINHLSQFLMTNLLLDLLEKAAPSRVVIVSSTLHERGEIDFDDLNLEKTFEAIKNGDKAFKKKMGRRNPGYSNTKLMNVYFGKGLAERTADKGIDVFMVCPGFTYTGLFRHAFSWYHMIAIAPIALFYMRSAEQGAQTVLHCATENYLEGASGTFFRNCKIYKSKHKFDKSIQDQLWDLSEKLVKLK